MDGETYRVRDVARLSGVTVRALHHYDALGLLVPSRRSDAGYRLYTRDDLLRLQQIVVARDLGLPLSEIREMLDDPDYDRKAGLEAHRSRLLTERARIDARLRALDAALAAEKGDENVTPQQMFEGFDPTEHEEEARERWGDTDAYREAARRTKGYRAEDWKRIREENDDLMERLAAQMEGGADPGSEAAAALAEEHRLHLDRWYYPCSHRMHRSLAEMYVADDRFRASFDAHAEGLTDYLAAAIHANADRG